MAILGIALALVGAFFFWYEAYMMDQGPGFGDEELAGNMNSLMKFIALLYIVGAGLSFLNSLSVLAQIPSLILGLPIAWYLGYDSTMFMYYWISFAGTLVITISMFIGYEVPGWETLVPPKSRLHVISISKRARVSRSLPRALSVVIATIIIVSMVTIASVAFYVRSEEVSRMMVAVYISDTYVGPVDITIYMDDEPVYSNQLLQFSGGYYYDSEMLHISSGTHRFVLDVWNEPGQLAEGVPDCEHEVRVLPFTTDVIRLSVGMISA